MKNPKVVVEGLIEVYADQMAQTEAKFKEAQHTLKQIDMMNGMYGLNINVNALPTRAFLNGTNQLPVPAAAPVQDLESKLRSAIGSRGPYKTKNKKIPTAIKAMESFIRSHPDREANHEDISNHLNDLGVKTSKGNPFAPISVGMTLARPIRKGITKIRKVRSGVYAL